MSILSKISSKFSYIVNIICPNCGCPNEQKISKGIKVQDFVSSGKCKCDNCGIVFFPKEYQTKWLK